LSAYYTRAVELKAMQMLSFRRAESEAKARREAQTLAVSSSLPEHARSVAAARSSRHQNPLDRTLDAADELEKQLDAAIAAKNNGPSSSSSQSTRIGSSPSPPPPPPSVPVPVDPALLAADRAAEDERAVDAELSAYKSETIKAGSRIRQADVLAYWQVCRVVQGMFVHLNRADYGRADREGRTAASVQGRS
jgi:hypothetical protein